VSAIGHIQLATACASDAFTVHALVTSSIVLIFRGVATAGGTGDTFPVRHIMSRYIKMTTDSLSSELTFDE